MTTTERRRPRGAGHWLTVTMIVLAILLPCRAGAIPGFYATTEGALRMAQVTSVVVMREGEDTVLTVRADVHGTAGDVVMVLPIPAAITSADVRTLPPDVIERLEWNTAPQLLEQWELDPCGDSPAPEARAGSAAATAPTSAAQEMVGEYEIAIVPTRDALLSWLHAHGYGVPASVAPQLARYARGRERFLIARVPAAHLRFAGGRARLSPLRVHYRSGAPVSLPFGIARGADADVVVHVLARERYEAANWRTVAIPTGVEATARAVANFDAAYAALLASARAGSPNTLVTEHAGPLHEPLAWSDLELLGADVLFSDPRSLPQPVSRRIEVQAEVSRARGPLVAEDIANTMRRYTAEVRYCYQEAAQFSGSVIVRSSIDASGVVRAASVQRTTLRRAPQVSQCIAEAVRRWRFARADAGGTTTADLRFTLSSQVTDTGAAPPWARRSELARQLVATRLHFQADPERPRDLVLRPSRATRARFHARYLRRHPWQGAIDCGDPSHGEWSTPTGPLAIARRMPPNLTGDHSPSSYFGIVQPAR